MRNSRSSGPHSISRENIGPHSSGFFRLQRYYCYGGVNKMKLQGIFSPIATPFDHNGEIYAVKVRHNVEKWNRTALQGYVVLGSTGESVMLTSSEKATLWEMVAQYAAPEKTLIAGTGAESVRETVSLTNTAAEMGYKAAMVRTPHYYKSAFSRPEAQMLFFRAVADQARIPVIIYNWPQTTGIDIPAEAVAALSEHPNIIAVKESSGSLEKVMQMVRETRAGFNVLVGSAPTLWPSLLMGACGGILAYANAAPYSCIAIWEAHLKREEAAGLDWQNRIARAARLVTVKYGIPGLKYAMDLNGYYGGAPRLPLTPPTAEAKKEIEEAFQDLKG
jgi:4-hydroxy-2-oxoglutarate aldolase